MRALVIALLVGCVEASTTPCGEDTCPGGTVCARIVDGSDELRHVCIAPEQMSCSETGAACALADGSEGTCFENAYCLPSACGDTIHDLRVEDCDDGNNVTGDGCSGDCVSNEACGNGHVDPLAATPEQCDDGNLFSHDGCNALCQNEELSWSPLVFGPPSPRFGVGLAYDPRRGRVVMFGGERRDASTPPGTLSNETWEFDGHGWLRIEARTAPPPTVYSLLTYHAGRVQLVGSSKSSSAGVATMVVWDWDGSQWKPKPVEGPVRASTAIAYDSARDRVVLFGGLVQGPVADTWEWDGQMWSEVSTATAPIARYGHAMAYDPIRNRTVLAGGCQTFTCTLTDTWEYDGATWVRRGDAPEPRQLAAMAFDALSGKVLQFGGLTANGLSNETLLWDGVTWTKLTLATAPPPQSAARLAPLPSGELVLFGGAPASNETWIWNGVAWRRVDHATSPALGNMASAYDSDRRRVVVFGGADQTASNTVWELADNRWRTTIAKPQQPWPAPTSSTKLVYDAARRETIMVGGSPNQGTWAWNGTGWRNVADVSHSPFPELATLVGHAMAYGKGQVVLVAGYGSKNETWTWDGTTWTHHALATKPPTRSHHAMAFDPIRGRIVLVGGQGTGLLDDVWEWDGSAWIENTTTLAPPARSNASLVWEPSRRKLVLIGGLDGALLRDAWEFDGNEWVALPLNHPEPRVGAIGTAATDGAGVVLLGGQHEGQHRTTGWHLRRQGPTIEACFGDDTDGDGLAGCADSDCWSRCTPECPPGVACAATAPRCGDGVCTPLEDCRICATDCGECAARCGDYACTGTETAATCPGDCE